MKLSRESGVLIGICVADLISTIYLVQNHHAREGNPLMNYYLTQGVAAFIAAKLVLFLLPVFLLEYARRQRPASGRIGLRVAIAAYLFAYIGGVAQLNQHLIPSRSAHSASVQVAGMVGADDDSSDDGE